MFLDIVGFSRNPNSRQRELVDSITTEVTSGLSSLINPPLETPHIVAMPTGDGMALAFLHQPNQPWDISTIMSLIYRVEGWAKSKDIALRTGVHAGEVDVITDINNKTNIVGDTINYTQRVMDAANPKQVLFSDVAFRQYIGSNTPSYSGPLYSPGCKAVFEGPYEVQAKHGMRMLVYKMTLDPPQDWLSNDDPVSKNPGIVEPTNILQPAITVQPALLTTKLFIPPARPGLVARPRLMECLRSALNSSLVLISAPAGSGKTTLVSDWVQQVKEQCPTGWVSLDEGDNDPVRFWDYFVAALKTIHPTVGEKALALLHPSSPQPYPIEAVLTALINDLTAIPGNFAVVLDDYHLIKAEAIQQGLTFLLDHMPPRMHLVLATRVDPSLPLAHFRGRRTMLEIDPDDLRFTQEEAAALLKELINAPLTAEDVSTLNTRTEGWAVGLTMAAISLGKQKNVHAFITSFTGSQRYVMDYLVEEVLKQQSQEVQDFFLKTSVLERLTAPLCDFVTGRSGSQGMLVKLESSVGGFLIPLDESRQWYRYHNLFAELLRHQLELKSGLEVVTTLHQRASQWYEDNGFPDDAVRHALAAKDWERAMRLIYAQSETRLNLGEYSTLLNWLQLIPDEVLRTHARLYSRYANVLITLGQAERAEAALSYLEATSQADVGLQGEVALFQMMVDRQVGNGTRMVEFGERALSLLPPDSLAMRARASFWLGAIPYNNGIFREALPLLTDAYEMGRKAGYYSIAASAAAYLGGILNARGSLRAALEMVQRAVDLAGQSPAAAVPRMSLSPLLYEANDLEGAAHSARLGLELSELGGMAIPMANPYFRLAQIRLVQGDIAGANAMMAKADQADLHPIVSPPSKADHAANHVVFALQQDDLAAATVWGNRLKEYGGLLNFPNFHVPARLLIAHGEKTAAMEQLRDLYEKAISADEKAIVLKIRVCRVLAAATPDEALTFLTEALTLGQPEGFIRTFVDEGKLLAPLLRQALAHGILPEYTGKLLSIIEAEERQREIR